MDNISAQLIQSQAFFDLTDILLLRNPANQRSIHMAPPSISGATSPNNNQMVAAAVAAVGQHLNANQQPQNPNSNVIAASLLQNQANNSNHSHSNDTLSNNNLVINNSNLAGQLNTAMNGANGMLTGNSFNQHIGGTHHSISQSLMQQQINAAAACIVAQQQQKQQNQQQYLFHQALQRAVSIPNGGSVVSLVSSLIENLGHRKLERTQSEPLNQAVSSRYKTELCRPFEEAGECKYGEKCQFAHGFGELRNLQRHPKYKTELCRTFHSVGFCPYGPRCHFVHNAEEARNLNRSLSNGFQSRCNAGGQPQQMNGMSGGRTLKGINGMANVPNPIPIGPSLSMSTGSDRASPSSGSMSPSNSIPNLYPHGDQNSPTYQNQPFAYPTNGNISPASAVGSPVQSPSPENRLPVFNKLSSNVESFTNLTI